MVQNLAEYTPIVIVLIKSYVNQADFIRTKAIY